MILNLFIKYNPITPDCLSKRCNIILEHYILIMTHGDRYVILRTFKKNEKQRFLN